jgi:hypothetical protein
MVVLPEKDYLTPSWPHPLNPPLQTQDVSNYVDKFVWRGGRKKEGLAPLLNAP